MQQKKVLYSISNVDGHHGQVEEPGVVRVDPLPVGLKERVAGEPGQTEWDAKN